MGITVPQPKDGTYPHEWATAVTDAANELSGAQIKIAAGVASITPTDSKSGLWSFYAGTATITFPSGLFSATPIILHSCNSMYPGRVIETEHKTDATATGFTLELARTDQTATQVHWIAIGV